MLLSPRVIAVTTVCLVRLLAVVTCIAALMTKREKTPLFTPAPLRENTRPETLLSQVVYINLSHRTDRREHIKNMLSTLGINDAERFEAQTPSSPLAQQLQICLPGALPGEYGCAASHLQLWRFAAAGNPHTWMLVFEDDVVINPMLSAARVRQTLFETVKVVPPHVAFIQFSSNGNAKHLKVSKNLSKLLKHDIRKGVVHSTACYAIRGDMARHLSDVKYWKTPVIDHVTIQRMNPNNAISFHDISQHPTHGGLFVQKRDTYGSDIEIQQ